MDDGISSEKKYHKQNNQISLLEYPICDGSGKQFDLKYSQYISSSSISPSFISKIPISDNFKSYEEYSYNVKKWYTNTKATFSRFILPTNISLFYRRPIKIKTLARGKNLITFDQLLQIEEILINEQKFDENTFFKNNIKSKSNLISSYVSFTNKWIGWSIPPFPEPEFFNCIDDFFLAANNWHIRCNQILSENVDKFITRSNSIENRNATSHNNNNLDIRSLDNKIIYKNHSHCFYDNGEKIPKENLLNVPIPKYELNNYDKNDNENKDNINTDIKTDNNSNNEKSENAESGNANNSNQNYENENFNKNNFNHSKEIEVEPQDNFPIKKTDIDEQIANSKFNYLMHPISFHYKYNFEIIQLKNRSNINEPKCKSIPLKTINQNSFFKTIQFHSKLKFDENPKLKEKISNSLKEMNYFSLNDALFPNSKQNPIIGDLINYGCTRPIRNSYPIPISDKDSENDNDDYSTSVRHFLYLIDLDAKKISKKDCNSLFQYVLSNHNNELFQNLMNNTQFLYKIAVILSYYIPSSSSFNDLQIIRPFDENDNFLNIDGLGEIFHFTPEIQIKLDLREIHGLLFQWHFSDVIYRIFGLIQSDNRQIEEASKTFLKRADFYRDAFKKFTDRKSFPFDFSVKKKDDRSLRKLNEKKDDAGKEKQVVIQIDDENKEINNSENETIYKNDTKPSSESILNENDTKNSSELIPKENDIINQNSIKNVSELPANKNDTQNRSKPITNKNSTTDSYKPAENKSDTENLANPRESLHDDATRMHHNDEDKSDSDAEYDSELNLTDTQFSERYSHLTRSYNCLLTSSLSRNSSLAQFSHLMAGDSQSSKTMTSLTKVSNSIFQSHSNLNDSENSEHSKTDTIDFTSHSFIELATSIFKVSLLCGVSSFVCPSCFVFLKFLSKSCRYDQKTYKKFVNEILTNRLMCVQFIKDFTENSMHPRFDISDTPDLLHFSCDLFLLNVRRISLKITNFEWAIQFFQHITMYLIDSYLHVYLIECILRFVLRSVDSENLAEWKSNVKTIQGLLYAYIPYERDWRLLASELRSFAILMKSADSFSFFDTDEKIEKIFQFLTVDKNDEVLKASFKILSVVFIYHSEAVSSYILKFQSLADFIEKAVSSLKELTKFDLVACLVLKLCAKLAELAFPAKVPTKSKPNDCRNFFALSIARNAGKGLAELLRILAKYQIRPNYLAFTIRKCLKNSENRDFASYIKIIERYETDVASRPAIKKLFVNYNIDYDIKLKKNS